MNVLILGLGSIARKHIAALRAVCPEVCISAFRHSRTSTPVEGVEDIYAWDDVVARKGDFDFVIIATPTSEHISSIQKALELRVPLFIEKPLSHTTCGIEQLVEQVKAVDVQTYVACNMRFLESICHLRSLIQDEKLRVNEVNVYCGSYLPDWRPGCDFRKVYSARPELGGGVHIDLIHELDYTYYIFGSPEKVHCLVSNNSSLAIPAIDYANYLLKYSGFCASLILNYYRRTPKRTIEILCDTGTYEVNLLTNSIYKDTNLIFQSDNSIVDTYKTQMEYFIRSIQSGCTMMNSMEEATRIMKLFISSAVC